MESSTIEHDIERFLERELKVDGRNPQLSRGVDLFDAGFVDSLGFAELLAFLEERFGVEVPEVDLLSEEFSTIDGIAGVIRRLAAIPH